MRAGTWLVWSKDERSGRWMTVNEGSKADMEAVAARMTAAAARFGIDARYVALPAGTAP